MTRNKEDKYYEPGVDYSMGKYLRGRYRITRSKPHFAQVSLDCDDVIDARKVLGLDQWDYSQCEDWLIANEDWFKKHMKKYMKTELLEMLDQEDVYGLDFTHTFFGVLI